MRGREQFKYSSALGRINAGRSQRRKKAENLFWKKGNSSDMSNNTDIAVPVMRYSDYLIGGISHATDYCRPSGRRKN